MPKMKTNKGAAKRFRLTGTGKVRRSKANMRHILTKKASKRKRRLRAAGLVHGADEARIKRMLGK